MASQKRTIIRNGTQIKRAVAYARFSSNNQREESIDAQLRAISEYCKKNNILLVDTFIDEAVSGKTDNRDDFQRMIKSVIKKKVNVDAVLVHKFNRFARNKYDSALYKKRLKDVGVRVISVSQSIDDTPEGELLEGFLEVIDQYYTANLAAEVRKGLRENALKGKHAGGQVLFGFSLDNEGYYIANSNAEIVKRIFEEYAAGIPKTEICARLNKEGYRNQRGKKFNTRTLYDLLRNEKYIGNYIYTIEQTEIIRLDGVIKDKIIDRKLWNKVQELNEKGTQQGRYREQKRYYHLTGKTFCEVCGSQICGAGSKRSRNGDLNYYYKCVGKTKHKNGCDNPSINKDWFEPRVLKSILNIVMNEEQVKEIAKKAYEELIALRDTPIITTKQLKSELSEIVRKQERLTDLYLDGDIDKKVLNERNEQFKRRRYEIEDELEKRQAVADTSEITEENIANFITEYIEYIKKEYANIDDEFMRAMLSVFVEKVVVGKEKITVQIHTPFERMGGGDSEWLSGLNHLLAPVKLQAVFKRKSRIHGKNE